MGWSFTTQQATAFFSGAVAGDLKKKLLHHLHFPTSTTRQQLFFWRRCRGRVEDLCKGSFSHAHPLLCYLFCFTLFILPALFYIKNPKKVSILGSCYFITLVHYAIP
jgi:hypothetical protein